MWLQLMAEEGGLALDQPGFEACMQEQRQRSRAAGRSGGGPTLRFEAEATAHLQRSGVHVTDDRPKCDHRLLTFASSIKPFASLSE